MASKVIAVVLFVTGLAFGQARYDNFTWSVATYTPGLSSPVVTVPGAKLNVCAHPANAVPCTNYETTYTDATLTTPCSNSTQVVLQGTDTCVANSDSYGNFGFYTEATDYDYTVTYRGTSVGPYHVVLGVPDGGNVSFKYINGTCMVDQFSGSSLAVKWNNAIADSNCSAKIYNLTKLTGAQTLSTTVTLPAGSKSILGLANITATSGAYISVPMGVNNVSLEGQQNGAPSDTTHETIFTSQNVIPIIKVGDATGDTYGFKLSGIAWSLRTAGNAAIGLQLNRAINYELYDPACYSDVTGTYTAQVCLNLEGGATFTGIGKIYGPYFTTSQSGFGIYSLSAANANAVFGGNIVCATGGTGIYLKNNSSGGNPIGGNLDIEGCAIGARVESSYNTFNVRFEGNTLDVQIDAGAQFNTFSYSPFTYTKIANNSGNNFNSFVSPSSVSPAWDGAGGMTLKNQIDHAMQWVVQPGSASDQNAFMLYRNHSGSNVWSWNWGLAAGTAGIDDAATSRLQVTATDTSLNGAAGANKVQVGMSANSGTGGFCVGPGGTSPGSCSATIDGGGKGTFTGFSTGTAGVAGHASCWKTTTTISYCESVVASDGTCTCH